MERKNKPHVKYFKRVIRSGMAPGPIRAEYYIWFVSIPWNHERDRTFQEWKHALDYANYTVLMKFVDEHYSQFLPVSPDVEAGEESKFWRGFKFRRFRKSGSAI